MQIEIQYHIAPVFYPRVRNRRRLSITLLARLIAALGKSRPSLASVRPLRGELEDATPA